MLFESVFVLVEEYKTILDSTIFTGICMCMMMPSVAGTCTYNDGVC